MAVEVTHRERSLRKGRPGVARRVGEGCDWTTDKHKRSFDKYKN